MMTVSTKAKQSKEVSQKIENTRNHFKNKRPLIKAMKKSINVDKIQNIELLPTVRYKATEDPHLFKIKQIQVLNKRGRNNGIIRRLDADEDTKTPVN